MNRLNTAISTSGRRWILAPLLFCSMLLPAASAEAQEHSKTETYLKQVGQKLRAAVKAGKLSEKEAKAKYQAIAKKAHTKKKAQAKTDVDLKKLGMKLREAVKAGKLSRKDAKSKYDAIAKKSGGKKSKAKAKHDKKPRAKGRSDDALEAYKREFGTKLRQAVADGKISKEDARKRWAAIEKGFAARKAAAKGKAGHDRKPQAKGRSGDALEAYRRQAGTKLRQAVADGKISKEDARKRWAKMEKGIAARKAAAKGKAGHDRKPQSKQQTTATRKQALARLESAIKAGKISFDDAMKRMKAFDKQLKKSKKASGNKKRRQQKSDSKKSKKASGNKKRRQQKSDSKKSKKASGKEKRRQPKQKTKDSDTPRKRLTEIRKRLSEAAEKGAISREDAKKRMEAAMRRVRSAQEKAKQSKRQPASEVR